MPTTARPPFVYAQPPQPVRTIVQGMPQPQVMTTQTPPSSVQVRPQFVYAQPAQQFPQASTQYPGSMVQPMPGPSYVHMQPRQSSIVVPQSSQQRLQDPAAPMPAGLTKSTPSAENNIILMTDGYKFSHHKQFPVSWLPEAARNYKNDPDYQPPILFAPLQGKGGSVILGLKPVPRLPGDEMSPYKITIVTNVSTAVAQVQCLDANEARGIVDVEVDDALNVRYPRRAAGFGSTLVFKLGQRMVKALKLPPSFTYIQMLNVDEAKNKRGSNLNVNYEGGYNVSYYTPRAYCHVFSHLKDENVVFFGLQYFMKAYLAGNKVITKDVVDDADAFISRYMADVRVAGPGVDFEGGYDHTMFPRGDWDAMMTGDYDAIGRGDSKKAGRMPIRIEALPEGTLMSPGVCAFKITNTHPRFFWLPNFLETLLVQVWYPMSVATQAREFKKTIQAYSILSQRVSQMADVFGMDGEFTAKNVAEDNLAIHVAQVFDLLDFGYRGVSSHETAGLGSAAYYTAGLEGSDTVAGSRMLLKYYNGNANFSTVFQEMHGATSVPAAEHSTITSWADVSPDADPDEYEVAEYNAFRNMIKQYMPSFAVSLVSDGFNIWNAVSRLWPNEFCPDAEFGGESMRQMLRTRLDAKQLTLIRPDSGEGIETLPQLLTILAGAMPEMWEQNLPPLQDIFEGDAVYSSKYNAVVNKIRANLGLPDGCNPFRRFVGQQMRVLQGDGVALDTVGDMCASLLANGFCANTVHFGSGGGLLQKLNRDSLAVAFKCCAMFVPGPNGVHGFDVGKDPIAGGKKSYGGNPPVVMDGGVLRNRGVYENGEMVRGCPMTDEEFAGVLQGIPVEGDCLEKVFENGDILPGKEVDFVAVQNRCKITEDTLKAALRLAVDNLELKASFMQKMTDDRAIAVRIAEASCGSKWKHDHPIADRLAELRQIFPGYDQALAQIGVSDGMTSTQVLNHIKSNLVCDKKAKSKIFRALDDDEPDAAVAAMGGKIVITL
eukprot:TRINITY_DN108308_c0_g1_i1.p1 TRINITY_DN108308_c0_g1~~TRINITY_DN108308_c0_g1_i1.p1  ORF type:complete len:1036 (-),score=220.98 TRINITY_DN108308_c0_g1_i1:133-3123(-)